MSEEIRNQEAAENVVNNESVEAVDSAANNQEELASQDELEQIISLKKATP